MYLRYLFFSRQLMSEIYQGLMILQTSLGSRQDVKAFEKKMTQREKETSKTFYNAMEVLNKVMDSFKKLKSIADELFESNDTQVSKAKLDKVLLFFCAAWKKIIQGQDNDIRVCDIINKLLFKAGITRSSSYTIFLH